MAIGDTINAALMRFDTSPLERAGMANAQANAAFGNALGMAAKGYFEGQEKKARTEEMTGYLMNQGVSESDAKAIAKNPFLQKEYQRKKETETQMEIEKNRLAMDARRIAQQMKLDERELGLRESAQANLIEQQDKLEDLQRGIARFQTAELEVPITPESMADPDFVPPPLDPDPFVAPPTTYTTQAPAVERLPKSFQPQGQRVIDAINKGDLTPMEGNRILEKIEAGMMSLKDRLDLQAKFEERIRKLRDDKRSEVEQERKDREFEGEQKVKSFDGILFEGKPLQGEIQDATEAKKAKEGLTNFKSIMRNLERLKELGMYRENNNYMSDDLKKEASILAVKIRGQIREEVLGPGTVQEAEYQRLADQVPDPTDSSFGPLSDTWSSTYGEEGVALIGKLQAELRQKVLDRFANYGVTFAPSGQPATSANQAQSNNTLTTRDGADVEFIDLTK